VGSKKEAKVKSDKALGVVAKVLAEFANLDEKDVATFQKNHPDFVPHGFWIMPNIFGIIPGVPFQPATKLWQLEQQRVREAWRKTFSSKTCLELIVSSGKASEIYDELKQREEQPVSAELTEEVRELTELARTRNVLVQSTSNLVNGPPSPRLWPYQHAVMYLAFEPWRAKICEECQMRFIANNGLQKYCGLAEANPNGPGWTKCRQINKIESQKKWWNKTGKRRRSEERS